MYYRRQFWYALLAACMLYANKGCVGGAENAGVENARVENAGATKYGKP